MMAEFKTLKAPLASQIPRLRSSRRCAGSELAKNRIFSPGDNRVSVQSRRDREAFGREGVPGIWLLARKGFFQRNGGPATS